MRPDVQAVQDFLTKNVRFARLDIDVLVDVVKSLNANERKLLLVDLDDLDERTSEHYTFLMQKVFNRHNDVVAGFTRLIVCGPKVEVVHSTRSNVSELAHTLSEYEALKDYGLDMIGDAQGSEKALTLLEDQVILSKE